MATYTENSTLKSATRLKHLLRHGLKAQQRLEAVAKKKADIERELVALLATWDRDKHDPVELKDIEGVPGRVKVSWNYDYEVDQSQAEKLKAKIGEAEFNRLFSTKKTYSRARSFGTWMKEAHGKLDKLKETIQGIVTKKVRKNPTIKWTSDSAADKAA